MSVSIKFREPNEPLKPTEYDSNSVENAFSITDTCLQAIPNRNFLYKSASGQLLWVIQQHNYIFTVSKYNETVRHQVIIHRTIHGSGDEGKVNCDRCSGGCDGRD